MVEAQRADASLSGSQPCETVASYGPIDGTNGSVPAGRTSGHAVHGGTGPDRVGGNDRSLRAGDAAVIAWNLVTGTNPAGSLFAWVALLHGWRYLARRLHRVSIAQRALVSACGQSEWPVVANPAFGHSMWSGISASNDDDNVEFRRGRHGAVPSWSFSLRQIRLRIRLSH